MGVRAWGSGGKCMGRVGVRACWGLEGKTCGKGGVRACGRA